MTISFKIGTDDNPATKEDISQLLDAIKRGEAPEQINGKPVRYGCENIERSATPLDIADIQEQLSRTANDPNLTIIT